MDAFQPSKKPLNNNKSVISIRMDISRVKEIDKIASEINISRNEFINQCVEYALNNLEFKKNKDKKENDQYFANRFLI